jgi:sec-independent protein translocase protein TatA
MRLGVGEILIILAIALLIFGPKKLPQLGDALGKAIRNFRKSTTEAEPADEAPAVAEPPRLAPGEPVAPDPAPKPPAEVKRQ